MPKVITDYWHAHYCTDHCTLCGNSGIIDTRMTARTAAGIPTGRLNYCIYPNGQQMRKFKINIEVRYRHEQP